MKIITNDAVYVQANDLIYLIHSAKKLQINLPKLVELQCFTTSLLNSSYYKNHFVSFTNSESIEFFKNFEYIIDYDIVKNLTNDELIQYYYQINEERMHTIQNNSLESQKESLIYKHELLLFKMNSIIEYMNTRDGVLKKYLPKEVKNNEKRLFKNLFKRNKNDL